MKLITIDGPSASGKGTVSQLVAKALGWEVLDSGALYRISAYAVQRDGIALEDEQAVAAVVSHLAIQFKDGKVWVDGAAVDDILRQESTGKLASKIAAYPALRQALFERQRAFLTDAGLVADGRDMGTVIFPEAPLKIFLIADVRERANRRYKQLLDKGLDADFEAILADLQRRDEQDMNRAVAPLKPADDAVLIDSSHMGIQEVVDSILREWEKKSH
ncbi:(d)CMP kinase [Pelistega europaea]|uniref:Cytidylate kinase n=1 Tax=Pelistega europaea TaxID=106147 RepID=A0A7Y4P5X0_9BURK|nr:(d)CMP kinase [Pelistega europaea]NOL50218.1 (d)CMP kinase [Pelistega europaea]